MNMGHAYDEQINLNYETDFYNEVHLNYLGQRKYTDFFACWLKEHYDLPDRRDDKNYIIWEAAYAEYDKYYQTLTKKAPLFNTGTLSKCVRI